MDSIVKILFSVVGAEAVTGSLDKIRSGSGALSGELLKLGGVAFSLHKALSNVSGVLELGRQLEFTSMRTSQSVKDVVVLGSAFKRFGLEAESVGTLINKFQKSLSGVNEMGESTRGILQQLGLSAVELREATAVEQMEMLARGFQRIDDPARRAAIAMALFGREGTQMLGLLSNPDLFESAIDGSSRFARRMQENSAEMKKAIEGLEKMKSRMKEMWVEVTIQLLPAINALSSAIKSLNLSSVGAGIGAGGMILLGGGLASSLTANLDKAVMTWATSPATSAAATTFAQRWVLPMTSALSKFFSTVLPAIIVLAIGGALIAGVERAIIDGHDRIDALRDKHYRDTSKAINSLQNATSLEDYNTRKAPHQDELKKSEERLAILKKERDAIAAHNAQIRELAKKDLDPVDRRATLMGLRSMSGEESVELEELEKKVVRLQQILATPPPAGLFDKNRTKQANEEYVGLGMEISKLAEKVRDSEMKLMSTSERRVALEAQLAEIKKKQASSDSGLTKDDAEGKQLKLKNDELQIQAELKAVTKEIADSEAYILDLRKGAELLTERSNGRLVEAQNLEEEITRRRMLADLKERGLDKDKESVAAVEEAIAAMRVAFNLSQAQDAQRRGSEAIRASIVELAQEESDIAADYTRTEAEKWQQLRANLDDQLAKHDELIAKLKEELRLAALRGDQANVDQITTQLRGAEGERQGTIGRRNQLGPDPKDFASNWSRVLKDFRQEWTLTGKSIANSFGGVLDGAMQSITSNLTDAIVGAKSLGEALGNIGLTIGRQLIETFVRIGVQMAVTAILSKTLGAAASATAIALAAATSLPLAMLWAVPATLATIATMGAAAAQAPMSITAAKATVMATSLVPFETGGYTGDGDAKSVAGIVHRGEYVFSAPAVRAIGAENLSAMHAAAKRGSAGGIAAGTSVGRGGVRKDGSDMNLAFFNTQNDAETWLRTQSGRRFMIDFLRQHKYAL